MPARLVIGNWKMHTTRDGAVTLASGIVAGLQRMSAWKPAELAVGLAPPFPFLPIVREVVQHSPLELVAQDCHGQPEGAFTGEVSAPMLQSVHARRVIVGHSERRHGLGEDDAVVRAKLDAALEARLGPVLCVGETLEERDAGRHEEVVARQVRHALGDLPADRRARVVVAYEPVWAIGTGRTATPEQAGAMHRAIHRLLADLGEDAAAIPVLYGGSVKPGNMEALAATPGVDGALVGGASLDAASFVEIVRGAASTSPGE